MAKPFFPTRTRGWALVILLLGLLGTIFFPPVYAYSGPGPLTHRGVAHLIQTSHAYGEGWPHTENDLKVRDTRRWGRYHLALKRTLKHLAVYRIVVDDKPEVWMVNESGKTGRLLIE